LVVAFSLNEGIDNSWVLGRIGERGVAKAEIYDQKPIIC
jgi:hypothetical protein